MYELYPYTIFLSTVLVSKSHSFLLESVIGFTLNYFSS